MNLLELFIKKGIKYAMKTDIYKSLGLPDPNHPHLGLLSQILRLPSIEAQEIEI